MIWPRAQILRSAASGATGFLGNPPTSNVAAVVQARCDVPTPADLLSERAESFTVRVLKFVRTLSREPAVDGVARQLARSGPGISSNYRSARRARSRAEFIARLAIVVDEADETEHWLSVILKSGLAYGAEVQWLWRESGELRAIFSKSLTTARENHKILKS
jgi:four helix bundle protein